jgi:hypothetical protein
MFVVGERAMVQVHANDGEKYELLDLQTAPPQLLWSGRPEWVVSYDERSAPDTIVLLDSGPENRRSVFLRVAGGRVMAPLDPCGYIATTPRLIVAQCIVHSKHSDTIEAFEVDSSDARRMKHGFPSNGYFPAIPSSVRRLPKP